MKITTKILLILIFFSSEKLPTKEFLTPSDRALISSLDSPEQLPRHKVDINFENLLTKAARQGDLKAVELLLEHKADLNQADLNQADLNREDSLTKAAVQQHNSAMVKLLLKHDADPNCKDLLASAVQQNNPVMVKLLLEHNAHIDKLDKSGHIPLRWAVFKRSKNMVKLLLQYNADINDKSWDGHSALGFSVSQHDFETTKLLFENNADPNSEGRNSEGERCYSPLQIAKQDNCSKIVALFSESKPDRESEPDDAE